MNQYVVHLPISFKGWIMEGIARDSATAIGIRPRFHFFAESKKDYLRPEVLFGLFNFRKSKVHIFMHHRSYFKYANLVIGRKHVFLTHFDFPGQLSTIQWEGLASADRVITQNSDIASLVEHHGVERKKILVGYGGVSRSEYFPMSKLGVPAPYVLIVGECKPRKNPKFLEEIVLGSPNLDFVIHGNGWLNYIFAGKALPKNLEVHEFEKSKNPKLMREASALLSVATNEGGPFPVLEALASGTPVVATPTGFCPDLVSEGRGCLLTQTPDINEVQEAITVALDLKAEIATQDLLFGRLTWNEFGFKLYGDRSN